MARTALGPIPWPWMNKAVAYQNKKFDGDGINKDIEDISGINGQENGKNISKNIFYISISIFYTANRNAYKIFS